MRKMDSNFNAIELQELIQKLVANGQSEIVEAFLSHGECTTKNNRINKSSCCRILKWKTKQLEEALQSCREILQKDVTGE